MGIGGYCLQRQTPRIISIPEDSLIRATLRLESDPIEKPNSRQAYATLLSEATSFPLLLYLPKDSVAYSLQSGDILITQLYIREIQNSGNPYSFDFKQFMLRKGIRYAANIRHYTTIKTTAASDFENHITILRRSILEKIERIFPSPLHHSFISTILLGYRHYLPDEVREDFSRSGLSHILAVSGLHTGILFMMLMFILWPLRLLQLKKGIYLLALLLMWGYALLAGMPASVVRAVCMISVYLIGKILQEDYSVVNALFITVFFMLLVRPFYLFEVGFQLSFLAVLSIIIYQPMLRKWIPVSHPLIKRITDLLLLSLAAQILVLPVSVYYFHLIPLWFLPANLLVIPLLSPLLLCTLANLTFLSAGIQIPLLDAFLNDFVAFLLKVNQFFSHLPAAPTIYLSQTSLLLILITIFAFTCFLWRPKPTPLFATLLLLLVLSGRYYFQNTSHPTAEIILFNQQRANSIHFIADKNHSIYSPDSGFSPQNIQPIYAELEERQRLNEAVYYNTDTLSQHGIFVRYPFLEISGKHFCMLTDRRFEWLTAQSKPKVHYLVVGGKCRHDLFALQKLVKFDTLILLPTLPRYRRMHFQQVCDSLQIPLYDISRNGAFRLTVVSQNESL